MVPVLSPAQKEEEAEGGSCRKPIENEAVNAQQAPYFCSHTSCHLEGWHGCNNDATGALVDIIDFLIQMNPGTSHCHDHRKGGWWLPHILKGVWKMSTT